jgi:hypothetical protein
MKKGILIFACFFILAFNVAPIVNESYVPFINIDLLGSLLQPKQKVFIKSFPMGNCRKVF